eukprot:CAMPEP_0185709460 /NCGR_PEP_ID=MMETSP1164-20130828/28704_1 /TAXON_ID=1104430 /ORGANISM="Chrysoreinhardia sp, Strain CCMP2950" /LENGTH=73 /DNA_ID=CAMNT_0028376955 /DNA_START=18 /DNA_END=235 /DNA_ORIENTATION=+
MATRRAARRASAGASYTRDHSSEATASSWLSSDEEEAETVFPPPRVRVPPAPRRLLAAGRVDVATGGWSPVSR